MAAKEEQIRALLEPTVEALGFDVWGLEYLSRGRNVLLRLYIDAESGVTVAQSSTLTPFSLSI